MLALRVYVATIALPEVEPLLAGHPGMGHVIRVGQSPDGEVTLVTADVVASVVDTLLPDLRDHGVAGDDIAIVHRESNRPIGTTRRGDATAWSGGGFAWSELTITSRQYAHVVPQYLVVMVCAGVISVFGFLTSNPILVVGAMAISPDLLPMCAICVGLADLRRRLVGRALAVLLLGLGVAGLASFVTASLLRSAGYGPATVSLSSGALGVLPSVKRRHGDDRRGRGRRRGARVRDPVQLGGGCRHLDHDDPGSGVPRSRDRARRRQRCPRSAGGPPGQHRHSRADRDADAGRATRCTPAGLRVARPPAFSRLSYSLAWRRRT